MKKLLLSLLALGFYTQLTYSQIFSQNFSSSSTVSDYASAATPTTSQFNTISTSGAGTVIDINSSRLRYSRTANVGSFSRITDFSPIPEIIIYKLDISISGNSVAQTTAAVFQVGSGFGTANSTETNTATHSRFGVNLTANSGEFTLRDIGGLTNSLAYTGTQTITWVINNSASSYSYTPPSGIGTETVASDTWDLFIGNIKEFNDRNATTTTQSLSDLKFAFTAGNGTIEIDNIIIHSNTTLPITLTSFTGKEANKSIVLNWVTASEKNNKNFEILRSVDGKSFKSIGTVAGAGDSDAELKYSFVDANPFGGTNYYQLKQIDFDGKNSTSEIIAVDSKITETRITVYAASSSINIGITSPNETSGKISLFDVSGRKISEQNISLNKGYNTLELNETLTTGVHFVTFENGGRLYRQKFVK